MKRREFIAGLGGAAAAWPLVTRAQQQTKATISWLGEGPLSEAEFRRGLAEVGFSEGRDITIEHRSALREGRPLPAVAADLVRGMWPMPGALPNCIERS